MAHVDQHLPFRVGSRDGRHNALASSIHISYKPPAIRFICLLGFTALFVGCIGAIEWLISETSIASSSASSAIPAANLNRRKLTTITTYNVSDLTCAPYSYAQSRATLCTMNSQAYRSQSAIAQKSFTDLCSAYSITFAPYQHAVLPNSLRAPFTQWTNSLSQQSISAGYAEASFFPCTFDSVAACSRDWWYVYNSTSLEVKTFTVGCSLMTTKMNPPCAGRGGVSLLSNGSITTSTIMWCGAKKPSQMLITTDVAPSTSISLEPLGADKAVADVVPFTTTAPDHTVSNNAFSLGDTSLYTPNLVRPTGISGVSTGLRSSITSSALATITSKATVQTTQSQSAHPSASVSVPGDSSITLTLAKNELIVQRPFTWITYFVAVFFPAIIAVMMKSLWEIIATSLKLVEPFQRLTEGVGANAKNSLLTQYFESMVSFDLFRALAYGRVIPISSALIYIMVEVAPLVASLSMTVKPRKSCLYEGMYRPCDPAWILNMPLVRLLEAFLLVSAALSLSLIYFSRKGIPVLTNPGSIASLAALLNHEPMIRELRRIDPDANGRIFKSALKNKLFRLAEHYDTKSEQTRMGFILSRGVHHQSKERSKWWSFAQNEKSVTTSYEQVSELPDLHQPHRGRRSWSCFDLSSHYWLLVSLQLLTTSGLIIILFTYWFDTNTDDAFNRFFNGDSIAQIIPKTLFIGLAVVVDIQMKYLEKIVRITDPFRRLGMRNARPETTILLPLNGTCWSNLGRSLYLLCRYEFSEGRMLWATMVTFVACLGDINIIAVAGFLQNAAQTEQSYAVCGYLSMICTSAMFVVILITMIWWLNVSVIRRMPRQPDTIGHILSYLCGSEMVRDFNTVSMSAQSICYLDSKARDDLIKRNGRRFCFGRMLGTDEKERWCIDYEREHSQVMVVNDIESRSIMSVPPIPEHWQPSHQQIKRKPVPVRVEQESRWEVPRTYESVGRRNSAHGGRFPSLRSSTGQGWTFARGLESSTDHEVLIQR